MEDNNNLQELILYSSSQESIHSDISSINLNSNEFLVKRIKFSRNIPRINNGINIGSLAFDIIWEDDSESREPIQNLINFETQQVNYYLCEILSDFNKNAIKYPNYNRCCIMCYNKAEIGKILCNNHMSQFNFLIITN
jgi:hypothetical protein